VVQCYKGAPGALSLIVELAMRELVQFIYANKDGALLLVSFMAVGVSLLTAIVAPIVQMRIARFSAATTTLVATRIKWIESMQSDMASLTTLVDRTAYLRKRLNELYDLKHQNGLTAEQTIELDQMRKEFDEKLFQQNTLATLVGIKLDIPGKEREEFFRAINELARLAESEDDYVSALRKMQFVAQDVIKREWAWVERQVGSRRMSSKIILN
jgi:uncharacterized protein YnzC (UPF0291/DUF896 family)